MSPPHPAAQKSRFHVVLTTFSWHVPCSLDKRISKFSWFGYHWKDARNLRSTKLNWTKQCFQEWREWPVCRGSQCLHQIPFNRPEFFHKDVYLVVVNLKKRKFKRKPYRNDTANDKQNTQQRLPVKLDQKNADQPGH